MRIAEAVATAWLAVMPPDPGRVRLYGAARVTLTGLLTWAILLVLTAAWPLPAAAILVGVASSLSAAAFVRDPTLPAQCITLAGTALAGGVGMVIGLLVQPVTLLLPATLVVLIFLAVYSAEFGPRWPVEAVSALSGFIFVPLTRPSFETLPLWFAAMCVGALSACALRLLLPDRPATVLARMETSIRASIDQILLCIDHVARSGDWRPANRRTIRREIELLNQATMLAEAAAAAPELAGHGPAAALHFFALELVTERFARQMLAQLPPHAALSADIEAVRRILAGDRHATTVSEPLLANLATLLVTPPQDAPAPDITASTSAAATPSHTLSSPVLHHALQASLASAIAIIVGTEVSPRRWYWGAMTAYVLFQGIRSRADSLAKALQTVVGTMAGALVGLLLASALAGHPAGLIIAIFAGVFLAYQASQAAYAVMTFWLTICLGLMFGLLGAFSFDVLLIRLLEAAIGAVAGGVTAWLFIRTSAAVVARKSGRDLLAALLAVVQAAGHAALAAAPEPALAGLAVTLHTRIGDLVTATRPRLYGLATLGDRRLRRQVVALTFCANWGRELALSAMRASEHPTQEVAAIIRACLARIAVNIGALSRLLDDQPKPHPTEPPADPPPPTGLPETDIPDTPAHIARLLLRIDSALSQLIRRAHAE